MHVLIPFASLIALVAAQGSSTTTATAPASSPAAPSPSALPACVIACAATAATTAGCALTDARCLCTNTAFQQASIQCITSACSPAEQSLAAQFAEAQCAAFAPSASVRITTSASATATSTRATSSPAATSSRSRGTTLAANGVLVLMNALIGAFVF